MTKFESYDKIWISMQTFVKLKNISKSEYLLIILIKSEINESYSKLASIQHAYAREQVGNLSKLTKKSRS